MKAVRIYLENVEKKKNEGSSKEKVLDNFG